MGNVCAPQKAFVSKAGCRHAGAVVPFQDPDSRNGMINRWRSSEVRLVPRAYGCACGCAYGCACGTRGVGACVWPRACGGVLQNPPPQAPLHVSCHPPHQVTHLQRLFREVATRRRGNSKRMGFDQLLDVLEGAQDIEPASLRPAVCRLFDPFGHDGVYFKRAGIRWVRADLGGLPATLNLGLRGG